MKEEIEFIENREIVTYRLKIDKNRRNILKNRIKKLGIEEEIEIRYDACHTTAKDAVVERGLGDEFLGFVEEKPFLKSPTPTPHHIKYGAPIRAIQKVKVKNYPILYHILFGKYRIFNTDLFGALQLYLSNQYGLKDETNKDLFNIFKRMQQIKGEPLEIIYDNNLSPDQIKELIGEFLETITYLPIKRESVEEINHQLDVVSTINIKSDAKTTLIEEMKTRLLTAQKNTENLEIVNKLLNKNFKSLTRKVSERN